MKIGLLAYHSVNNYGAKLQLLSTYCFFKKQNIDTVIINWVPNDLEQYYVLNDVQTNANTAFREQFWEETPLCRNAQDIASVIEKEGITAVVIGSDAVAQHHPFLERLRLSSKKILYVNHPTSDRMFPNPFWGEFNRFLNNKIPTFVISASSQDSDYRLFSHNTKKKMRAYIRDYRYLSVRDPWTKKMFESISKGRVSPDVTPDPVFGFNYNAGDLIPERKYVLEKYGLKQDYVLASFRKPSCVSQQWINSLKEECIKRHFELVSLPFSDEDAFGEMDKHINYPVSPLEWYSLIKYSKGYIGNNMHPIVVSLHNGVPFFSFDNYGRRGFGGLTSSDKSSKIKHIIGISGLSGNRVSCISRNFVPPQPKDVLSAILNFDSDKAEAFAKKWYKEYEIMMDTVLMELTKIEKR